MDGGLNFDTKIDTDGVEKGAESIKDVMKRLINSIDGLVKSVDNAINSINVSKVATEMQKVEQSADSASESIQEIGNDANNSLSIAEMSAEELQRAMDAITITWHDDVKKDIDDITEALNETSVAVTEVAHDIQTIDETPLKESSESAKELNNTLGFIKHTFTSIPAIVSGLGERIKNAFTGSKKEVSETQNEIQELIYRIDTLKDALVSMEGKGLYFGDKEYDNAYSELTKLESKLRDYKRSLTTVDGEQKKVAKSNDKVNQSMKKTSKTTSKFSKMMKMLGKSLMFSIVFRAFSAITKSISEGFQNLAQYSPKVNKGLSALATSMQTLKNSFATAFSPILTAIAPALQTLINYLSQALTVMGQFFAVLFTGATTFTKAKDAQIDYAKSLKQSAKEANKSLSSIDKLNSVGDDSSGGYSAPSPGQMFEEIDIDKKLINFIEDLKRKLEPVIDAFDRFKVAVTPFAKNVGRGLKWFLDNVLIPLGNWTITNLIPAFLDTLGASIGVLNSLIEVFKPYGQWLWDKFLLPIATWTGGLIIDGLNALTVGLNALSDWIMNNQDLIASATLLIASFFLAFKVVGLVTALAPLISAFIGLTTSGGLLAAVLSGIGAAIGFILSPATIIAAILGLLIYTFIDLYSSSESFRNAISELGQTWKDALEPLATFVSTVLSDAWNEILKPAIDFFVTTLIPNLIDIFKQLWEKVLVPLGTYIGTVLQPVFKVLSDILTSIWKNVVLPLAKAIGTTFKEAWNGLYQILTKTVIPILEKVIKTATKLWKEVINPIIKVLWENLKPAFDTVFKGIGNLITDLQTILSGIITFITGVFTGDWEKAWEGIKKIFKGIFDSFETIVKTPINAVIDIINGMMNGIVTGVNTVIKAINSISFTMPDWIPGLGGKSIGFNLRTMTAPRIPKLATGAVIPPNSEFLAILGDQKKGVNIEAPLDTIVEAFRRENGGNGSVVELHLHVYEDGKQRFETVVKYEKENFGKTGKSIFVH